MAEVSQDGKNTQRKGIGCFGLFGIFIALIIVLVVVSVLGADDEVDENAVRSVGCKNLVEENLRSPSSAKFVGLPVHSGDTVSGEVDAQNAFGATIRSEYQCSFDGDLIRLDYIR